MSVPATNALSPAPRNTRTLTRSSASTCSQQSYRPSYMAQVSALRAWGRLKVRKAMAPSHPYSNSAVFGPNSVCSVVTMLVSLTWVNGGFDRFAYGTGQRQLEGQGWC